MVDLTSESNDLTFLNSKLTPSISNDTERRLSSLNEEKELKDLEKFMLKINEERFKNDEDWLLDDKEERPKSRLDSAIYDWISADNTQEQMIMSESIELPSDQLLRPDHLTRGNYFTQGRYRKAIDSYKNSRLPGTSDTDSISSLIDLEPLTDLALFDVIEEEISDLAKSFDSTGDLKDSIETRSATKASNNKQTSSRSQSKRNSVSSNYSLEELLKPLDEQMDFKSSQLEIPDSIQEYFEKYSLYIAECERKGISAEEIIANAPSIVPSRKPKAYSPPTSPRKFTSKSPELNLMIPYKPTPSQPNPFKSSIHKTPNHCTYKFNSKVLSALKETPEFTNNEPSSLASSCIAKSASTLDAPKMRSNVMYSSNPSSVSLPNTALKQSSQISSQVLSPNNKPFTLQRSLTVMKSNSITYRNQSKPNSSSSQDSLNLISAPTSPTFSSSITSPRFSVHLNSMEPRSSISPKTSSSPKESTTPAHQSIENVSSVSKTNSPRLSRYSKVSSQNDTKFVSRIPKPGFASANRQDALLTQNEVGSQILRLRTKSSDKYNIFIKSNIHNAKLKTYHKSMIDQNSNVISHYQLKLKSLQYLQTSSSSSQRISPPMTDYSKTNPRIARALSSMTDFESKIPIPTPNLLVRHRPHQNASTSNLAYPHNPRLSMMISSASKFESRIPRPSQLITDHLLLPKRVNFKSFSAQYQPLG